MVLEFRDSGCRAWEFGIQGVGLGSLGFRAYRDLELRGFRVYRVLELGGFCV